MARSVATFALLSLLLGAPSFAATEVVVASADNTLYESTLGELSNGAGEHIVAGRTNEPSLRRAIFRFDLSAIPAGSIILEVTLTLTVNKEPPGAMASDFTVHRLTADWGEAGSDAGSLQTGLGVSPEPGDATWLHTFSPGSVWATLGGDFVATASDTASVDGPGAYSWISTAGGADSGLVDDVQGWVDGTFLNAGWALLGDETVDQNARRFDSRETTAGTAPTLTVVFAEEVFTDDFETGDFTAWSSVVN